MPKRPVRLLGDLARRDLGDHGEHPVGDLVELHALVQVLGERLVDDRDRADPAHGLLQGFPAPVRLDAAGLEPQQGGDRLEVVLHPVVDLPDGGVLGDQFALAAAQFGDIAEQDQGTDAGALGLQRDRPELDHPVCALDLELTGRPAAGHLRQRLVHRTPGRGEFGGRGAEVVTHQVGGQADAVVRRERVRRGVLDDAVRVEADQPVADPGRGVHVDLLVGEREGARRDHLREVGGALEIRQFEAARGAHGEQVGVARDDSEDPALTPYGNGLDPDRNLLAPLGITLAHDPALVERGVQQGRRPRGTRWPTMSSWYEVGPVLGRIWATET